MPTALILLDPYGDPWQVIVGNQRDLIETQFGDPAERITDSLGALGWRKVPDTMRLINARQALVEVEPIPEDRTAALHARVRHALGVASPSHPLGGLTRVHGIDWALLTDMRRVMTLPEWRSYMVGEDEVKLPDRPEPSASPDAAERKR